MTTVNDQVRARHEARRIRQHEHSGAWDQTLEPTLTSKLVWGAEPAEHGPLCPHLVKVWSLLQQGRSQGRHDLD